MTLADLLNAYNTQLSSVDEDKFLQWAASNNKMRDLEDYDLRGAWKAGALTGGHGPDTYKKPNHPTFSNESMYSTPQTPGGEWQQSGDNWAFWASPQNMQNMGMQGLSEYFRQVEPGNNVIFPVNYQLPRRQ